MYIKTTLVFAAALACAGAEPAAGRWEGKVQIPGRELRLVIDLDRDSQGQWSGSAIIPGFDVKGAPLKDIAVKPSEVSFTIKGALGEPALKGHLSGDVFSGEYQQAGNTAPFALKKSGPPQVEPPRASTPVTKELAGEWRGDMNFSGRELHVKVNLTNQQNGRATAEVRITGKAERTFPFELVTQDGDSITIESTDTGLKYEGRFRRDLNEITGTFSQGGDAETPLVMRRAPSQEKP